MVERNWLYKWMTDFMFLTKDPHRIFSYAMRWLVLCCSSIPRFCPVESMSKAFSIPLQLLVEQNLKCKTNDCIYLPVYIKYTEKAMAPHSSTLTWKIPWMEKPGRLQSMGSWRVGHDWATSLSLFTFMHWRRKWQPTAVFLPGESQGWDCTESDTTEVT